MTLGALVAAERCDRRLWADHRARLELALVPLTTASVGGRDQPFGAAAPVRRPYWVARSWRSPWLTPMGALAGASGVADLVDVHVVLVASRARASVLTSDDHDLSRVAGTLREPSHSSTYDDRSAHEGNIQ